jgi:hypothetical protein
MRIITYASWDSMQDFIAGKPADKEKSFEYTGKVALCDRALQGDATKNAAAAGNTATGYGTQATNEGDTLNPFFSQEMKAKHGLTPGQTNEMLTAAMAGSGGADSGIVGQANQEAARTRNASGFTKTLDEAARDRMKADAGASEGIAAQDVIGAKQLNQEGAAGMEGLYGTNVGAQLKAMGQQNEDIGTGIQAGNSGWLQNMNSTLTSVGNLAKGIKPGP